MSRTPRSVPHTVYDLLKTLDPDLPALPSFLRDEQAVSLLEVAIGVIGKRAKRTEEELKQIRADYDRLRLRTVETAQRNNRAFSHTPRAEAKPQTRRTDEKDLQLQETQRQFQVLQRDYQRVTVQFELSELKLQELKEVKGMYAVLLQDFAREEATAKSLSDLNRELREANQSLQQEVLKLSAQLQTADALNSSGQATERTVTMLTGALEKERGLLGKERSALLRAKREWIRNRPDQDCRLNMAVEDLRSHWLRLDEVTTEVLLLQENLQTQEESMKQEQTGLETTALYLDSVQRDMERRQSKSMQEQRSLDLRMQQIDGQKVTLRTKETQLLQLESVLKERMQSLNKLERALRRREEQLDCRSDTSWQFSTEVSNVPTLQESPVPLLYDLTPRDVITPDSTEGSPREEP